MDNDKPRHTGGGRQHGNHAGQNHNNHNRSRDNGSGDSHGGIDQPRKVTLKILADIRENDAYTNLLLPRLLRAHKLKDRDAAFATELTHGTLRAEGPLDAMIEASSSRPLSDIAGPVMDVLRLGAYQLLHTHIDAYATADTSVRSAAKVAGPGVRGFVNAVLQRVPSQTESEWAFEIAPDPTTGPIGYVTMKHTHPRWITMGFAHALGAQTNELQQALVVDDTRPLVHLVARSDEIVAEKLALITGGEEGPWSPYCVHLDSGAPGELEPVRQGLAAVRDEGSQLIARTAIKAPIVGEDSDCWLSLYSGPGGKSAFTGGITTIGGAKLDAVEVSATRAELVKKVTAGLPVTITVMDGRDAGLETGFDRILVDAPCSGLGSLCRRPETRQRKSPSDLDSLTTLQFELLSGAMRLAQPGGITVYSTCPPYLRETRGVVDRAVTELPVTELNAYELIASITDVGPYPSVQMWSYRHGTDTMFFSVLHKNGQAQGL